MNDDLARELREAGHPDLAEALERKQLGTQLRDLGRDDLADAVQAGAEVVPPAAETDDQRVRDGQVLLDGLRAKGIVKDAA